MSQTDQDESQTDAIKSDARLANELDLLTSMYPSPSTLTFETSSRELHYASNEVRLSLRLPASYLGTALPTIVSASAGRRDLRAALDAQCRTLPIGEEVLDEVLARLHSLTDETEGEHEGDDQEDQLKVALEADDVATKTVIIWTHHLLATSKRKQALSPSSKDVSGVTKPGYPGVMAFSGPKAAVDEHVAGLKGFNWQAFQLRFEEEGEDWFMGKGIREVETMGEVVEILGNEKRKKTFLSVMKMK